MKELDLNQKIELLKEIEEGINNLKKGEHMYQAVSLEQKYNETMKQLCFLNEDLKKKK